MAVNAIALAPTAALALNDTRVSASVSAVGGASTPTVCINSFRENGSTASVILGCRVEYEYGSTSAEMLRPRRDNSILPMVTRSAGISTSIAGARNLYSVVSAAIPSR